MKECCRRTKKTNNVSGYTQFKMKIINKNSSLTCDENRSMKKIPTRFPPFLKLH